MATNSRGHGLRVHVTVSAARSSGDFVYEDGFHGQMVNDAVNAADAIMDITQQEIEVAAVAAPALGDNIYITPAQALTETAGTNRLVGKVTAVAGTQGVPAGQMRMLVLPQNTTVPA